MGFFEGKKKMKKNEKKKKEMSLWKRAPQRGGGE
jgi:hypothetical protein